MATSNEPYVYDTGALLAAEAGDRRLWWLRRQSVIDGARVIVPAVVLAQAWRGGPRQALLAKLLKTTEVEPTTDAMARAAGALCGRARTSDVVDAIVATTAISYRATIVTCDTDDIQRLLDAANCGLSLVRV
ncbi:MAG: type II toxin-antitoxin system VapC family toxin [Actinopolymorphaceae bacterium]